MPCTAIWSSWTPERWNGATSNVMCSSSRVPRVCPSVHDCDRVLCGCGVVHTHGPGAVLGCEDGDGGGRVLPHGGVVGRHSRAGDDGAQEALARGPDEHAV